MGLHKKRHPGAIDLTNRIQIEGSFFREEPVAFEAKCLKCGLTIKVATSDPNQLEPFVSKHINECFPEVMADHEIQKGRLC